MKNAKRIASGVAAALGLYLALAALLSLLLVRGAVGEGCAGACVWAFACAAAFLGTRLAMRGAGDAMAPPLLCVAGFWCAILLAGYLGGGSLEASCAASAALAALTGSACAYLGGKRAGQRSKGKRKRRFHK